jgi:hypothetical protein
MVGQSKNDEIVISCVNEASGYYVVAKSIEEGVEITRKTRV